MVAPSRSWINKSALSQLAQVAEAYKQMASTRVVEQAATQAGETMATAMKSMVQSQPDLSAYHDVTEGFTAWRGPETIHAGLPDDHPLLGRAAALEEEFPLMEVMFDLEAQTGETGRAFYEALGRKVGLLPEDRDW